MSQAQAVTYQGIKIECDKVFPTIAGDGATVKHIDVSSGDRIMVHLSTGRRIFIPWSDCMELEGWRL